MDIFFKETERDKYKVIYTGMAGEEAVGGAGLADYKGDAPRLYGFWLTERGQELTERREFFEAFCIFLKEQGYTQLYVESLEMETGDELGIRLVDRDNSGWETKYFFVREL